MADPTSDIAKWTSFGWDDKSSAMMSLARFITEAGKTNSDYAIFAPEWFPMYGSQIAAYGRGVDPDDIEPFVNAWVKYAAANSATFAAPLAKSVMVDAGFDSNKSTIVANAMYHLNVAGKLPSIIASPAGWKASTGLSITDAGRALESVVSSTLTITKMLPWLLLGVGVFIAWPYISAARAPAKALGGIR